MTGRDGFGLAIRIGGGWKILESLGDLYYIVVKLLGLPSGSTLALQIDIDAFVFRFVVGALLIVTADLLVRIVYGPKVKSAE